LTENKNYTLILGASTNPIRYAYKATQQLTAKNHPIYLVGAKPAELLNHTIHTDFPDQSTLIDTITIYLREAIQKSYYNKILESKPRRVIFNPGTENHELAALLKENDIDVLFACTLVLLSTGQY